VTYVDKEMREGKAAAEQWAVAQKKLREETAQQEKGGQRLVQTLGQIQMTYLGLVGATALLTASARASVGAAMEQERALMRLDVLAQNDTRQLMQLREILDSNQGGLFSRTDTAASIAYARSIDISNKNLEKLLPGIRNLAALYGTDLYEATVSVGQALELGEMKRIKSMGLVVTQTELERKAIEVYGAKYSELEEIEAQTIRMIEIQEELNRLQGGEEEAATRASGAVRELKTAWQELQVDAWEPALLTIATAATGLADIAEGLKGVNDQVERLLEATSGRSLPETILDVVGLGDVAKWMEQRATARRWTRKARDVVGRQPLEGPPEPDPEEEERQRAAERRERRLALQRGEYWAWAPEQMRERQLGIRMGSNLERLRREHPELFPEEEIEKQVRLTDKDIFQTRRHRGYRRAPTEDDVSKAIKEEVEEGRRKRREEERDEQESAERRKAMYVDLAQTMAGTYGEAIDTMSFVTGQFFNRQVNTHEKLVALFRWAGKQMVSSTTGAIAEVSKTQAKHFLALALGKKAEAMWGAFGATGYVKAAMALGGLAVVAGGLSQATGAGAQRELAAFGRQGIPGEGEEDRITRTSRYGLAGGSILGRVERGPETVYYTFNTTFSGFNVLGGDEASFGALYESHIRARIQRDVETGIIRA